MKKTALFLIASAALGLLSVMAGVNNQSGSDAARGVLGPESPKPPPEAGGEPDSADENIETDSILAENLQQLVRQGGGGGENPDSEEFRRINAQRGKQAFNLLMEAAQKTDREFLGDVGRMGQHCDWCDSFYEQVREQVGKAENRSDVRSFLARALAQSGRADNVSRVVELMEQAAQHPEMGISPDGYANVLEDTPLDPEVVDQLSQDLASDNSFLREAAVEILTKQGTLAAAEKLYQHTVERNLADGYYRTGIGLGLMQPKAEALDFLESMAAKKDVYSRLAVNALLNYGSEGLQRVVKLMEASPDYDLDRQALRNAVDHVSFDPATLTYLEGLKNSGSQALKEFAQRVAKEREYDILNLNSDIEYNDNYASGLRG